MTKITSIMWLLVLGSFFLTAPVPAADKTVAVQILDHLERGGRLWDVSFPRDSESLARAVCVELVFALSDFSDTASSQAPRSLQDILDAGYFLFWPRPGTEDVTPVIFSLPTRKEREAALLQMGKVGRFAFWRSENEQAALLHISCTTTIRKPGTDSQLLVVRDSSIWSYHHPGSIGPGLCLPDPLCKQPGYLKWKNRIDEMRWGIRAYYSVNQKLPETPRDLIPLMGPLVEKAWTPEVQQVWEELLSRVARMLRSPATPGAASGSHPASSAAPPAAHLPTFPALP